MKIIHTADIHLDSVLSTHLSSEDAKKRKNELIMTFKRMVSYAANEGVQGIIIAGDLFDSTKVSATSRNAFLDAIQQNPDITFFYLRGNHDAGSFEEQAMKLLDKLPDNLKMFSENWTSYSLIGDSRDVSTAGFEVIITGAELSSRNNMSLVNSLALDQSKFNIVTLHGQEVESAGKKGAEIIPIKDYRNRGIDYLALGHIHEPKISELDARGKYSYSGCLEGRGFDECGPRGFNLITISDKTGKYDVEFIPFADRVMHELIIDVENVSTSDDVVTLIRKEADSSDAQDKDMVKAVMVGALPLDVELDIGYIEEMLRGDFFYITVRDKTKPFIDYNSFMLDKSLRGEFVRMVKSEQEAGNLSESDAAQIIKTGVLLLAGEEVLS